MEKEKDALSAIIGWVEASRDIVFLTGSELIFESGIPDASEPSFNPDIRKFKNSIEIREDYWEKIKGFYPGITTATPTPCHEAIYEISLLSNVTCIMTQNVDGLHQKAGNENVLELFASIHWVTCPDCGKDMRLKTGRFGPFWGCTKHPKCSFIANMRGAAKKRADQENPTPPKPKPIPTDVPCDDCGEPMWIRTGRTGPFLGCSKYPKCKATKPMPEGATAE